MNLVVEEGPNTVFFLGCLSYQAERMKILGFGDRIRRQDSATDSATDGFGDRRTNPHRFALRIGWNLRGHNSSCELGLAALRALTAKAISQLV
jgi:hypothetical protein